MKYQAKIVQKSEHTFEVDVPSYWKDSFSFYRVFQRKDEILCDIINDWKSLGRLEFECDQPITLVPFTEPITKQEWMAAMDLVIDRLDLIINEEEPQGEDSFYHLTRGLYPTHPELEKTEQ